MNESVTEMLRAYQHDLLTAAANQEADAKFHMEKASAATALMLANRRAAELLDAAILKGQGAE